MKELKLKKMVKQTSVCLIQLSVCFKKQKFYEIHKSNKNTIVSKSYTGKAIKYHPWSL